MNHLIFQFTGLFFLISNTIVVLGWFINSFFSISYSRYEKYFFYSLLGVVVPVVFFSFVVTKGHTINLFLFATLFFLIFSNRNRIKFQWNPHWSFFGYDLLIFNLLLLLIGCVCLFTNYLNFGWGISADTLMYASVSNNLINGFENGLSDLQYLKIVAGNAPYHYFELWVNGLFKFCFNQWSLSYLFQYVTFPLLYLVMFTGICAIYERHALKFVKWKVLLLVIILLFIGPLFMDNIAVSMNGLFVNSSSLFEIPALLNFSGPNSYFGLKNIPIYIGMTTFFLLLLRDNVQTAFIALAGLYVINIVFSLIVFPVLILFFSRQIYRGIDKQLYKNLLISHFIIGAGIFIFYYFLQEKTFYGRNFIGTIEIWQWPESYNWKGIIINSFCRIFVCGLVIIVGYSPYLLLMKYYKMSFKWWKEIFWIFSGAIFLATITRGVFSGTDSIQFLTYLFPILNVTVIITILLNRAKIFPLAFVVGCFSLVLYSLWNAKNISRELKETGFTYNIEEDDKYFIQQVNSKLSVGKSDQEFLIGFLLPEKIIKSAPSITWKYFLPGKFLLVNDYHNFVSLNFPNYVSSYSETYTRPTIFNHQKVFYNTLKTKEPFDSHIRRFVIEKRCRFLICSKEIQLPVELRKYYNDFIVGKNEIFYYHQ